MLWPVLAFSLAHGAEPLSPLPPEHRSRVVIVQNPAATQAFEPRLEVVRTMVDRAITNLTGKPTSEAAWRSLVSTQEVLGLKVYSAPGQHAGTRPTVVAAIVESLLAAGFSPSHIVVWDKKREDLQRANFSRLATRYGIQVEASGMAGWEATNFYDRAAVGPMSYGDLEYGKTEQGVGRRSFVSKLVSSKLTKIINVSPLLNHYQAGVSGNLYSLAMGSVDNTLRFEHHQQLFVEAIPEIYALALLGDRVVLNVVDALICQYEGELEPLLHYSSTLNELRFSTDPVALDVLSIQELARQRKKSKLTSSKVMELYENAAELQLGVSEPGQMQVERLR